MKSAIFALVMMLAPPALAAPPEWALRMEGKWTGQGERIDAQGNRTVIEAAAESHWSGALISKNHFDETVYSAGGTPLRKRSYDRVYWISEQADGTLMLGYGETPGEKASSRGAYDPSTGIMRSEQVIGGAMRVSVTTDLSVDGRSEYFEQIYMGDSLHSEARISYSRHSE